MDNSEPPTPRRPGKPRGLPKPPGSGRQRGTPNRVTRSVREVTQRKGRAALRELWKLGVGATDEKVRIRAFETWLAYAYGRPTEHRELTGSDGAALHPVPVMSDRETATRIAFILAKAVHAQGGGGQPTEPRPLHDIAKRVISTATPTTLAVTPAPSNDPVFGGPEDLALREEVLAQRREDQLMSTRPEQRTGQIGPAIITRRPTR